MSSVARDGIGMMGEGGLHDFKEASSLFYMVGDKDIWRVERSIEPKGFVV